ncbi:hypothetical protein P154DRAFT_517719 [Amniculicola lignicola CBS 123094]|uniref:Acyltransferase 3 domain-containing protein n=1 Tax=Amniculicola lignicola CBS 123094 TaxID=1392246 RepID=A0A6A5WXZ4_9PLEO|nr:hypothetical protein P154DRAFT_517719 [Amniculicola lignicola CBS 123094]
MGKETTRQNVTWVEGIRGMASLFVVLTHLCRAFNYDLFYPNMKDQSPTLFQLPFLRLPWQGRIGVTMFAFLTGYVCAIKPLRQVKSGQLPAALMTLGKSAFRRPPRLIMPSTVAMFVAWVFTQIGGFKVSKRTDSAWLRDSAPEPYRFYIEIQRFFWNFHNNWTGGRMEYDDHQWALLPLLQGAFLIYVVLFATVFMKSHYRIFTVFVLWAWYWMNATPFKETFECQFLWGVLLCDLGSEGWFRELTNNWTKTRRTVSISLIIVGWYVAGYPGEHGDWAAWSQQLTDIGDYIFPAGTQDYTKRWTAAGWILAVTGIWLSPTLQGILSNRVFMWIGRNSFAVYLIHGTLLRVVLVRMIYGWSGEPWVVDKNEQGEAVFHYLPRANTWVFFIAIPTWFALVYALAHLWTTYVDSLCAKATVWLEKTMFETEDNEKGVLQVA